MNCSVCYETENLEDVVSFANGKPFTLHLCPHHLSLFNKGKIVQEKKELESAMCCGTPINSNGRCAVCGDKY